MSLFNRIREQAMDRFGQATRSDIDYGDPRTEPGFMRTLRKPLVGAAIAVAGAALLSRMRKR